MQPNRLLQQNQITRRKEATNPGHGMAASFHSTKYLHLLYEMPYFDIFLYAGTGLETLCSYVRTMSRRYGNSYKR